MKEKTGKLIMMIEMIIFIIMTIPVAGIIIINFIIQPVVFTITAIASCIMVIGTVFVLDKFGVL